MRHHVLSIGLERKLTFGSALQPSGRIQPDLVSSQNCAGEGILFAPRLSNGVGCTEPNGFAPGSDCEGIPTRDPASGIGKVDGHIACKLFVCIRNIRIDVRRVPDTRHPYVKRKECFIVPREKQCPVSSASSLLLCAPSASPAASIATPFTSTWPVRLVPSNLRVWPLAQRSARARLHAKTNLARSPLAPQHMKCPNCKKRVASAVAFLCKWCTQSYCSACRLPEGHTCPSMKQEPVVLPAPVVAPKLQPI